MRDERPDPRLTESADIVFSATVRAERMRFTLVPSTSVTFHGEPGEESKAGGRRIGYPGEVAENEVYRKIRLDYVIASRLAIPGTAERGRPH